MSHAPFRALSFNTLIVSSIIKLHVLFNSALHYIHTI